MRTYIRSTRSRKPMQNYKHSNPTTMYTNVSRKLHFIVPIKTLAMKLELFYLNP